MSFCGCYNFNMFNCCNSSFLNYLPFMANSLNFYNPLSVFNFMFAQPVYNYVQPMYNYSIFSPQTYTPSININPPVINTPVINPYSNLFARQNNNTTNWAEYFRNCFTSNPINNSFLSLTSPKNDKVDEAKVDNKETKDNNVQFSQDKSKVTTRYSGTVDDLNKKLANRGVLAGKAATFIKAQEQYGINAAFLAAICINESGGTSKMAKSQNNVGGVRIPGKKEFKTYDSVDACIMDIASFLKKGYINKGLTTISQIGAKYCPVSDSTDTKGTNGLWPSHVSSIYNSLA